MTASARGGGVRGFGLERQDFLGGRAILGENDLDEGRSSRRGVALLEPGQVSLVELGVGGDKDAAAWAGDINGDPYPKAQIALCGLAQDIAQALGGHAYGFHNSRR